jgi:uncharacterized protein YrrD
MLYRAEELDDFGIRAIDEDIGKIEEFYFEDTNWMIRYIVVDTGSWLIGRKVLISPYVADRPVPESRVLPVRLTAEQVEKSPDIERDKPISRQHEHALHAYYGWPIYWGHPGIIPGYIAVPPRELEIPPEEIHYNTHLRSSKEIDGYRIHAADGEIGHVIDTVIDTESWRIRYLAIDTRRWLPGKKVLLSVDWVERISFPEQKIVVDLTRGSIQESPEFDASLPVTREYEERLYEYYDRPGYWIEMFR